MLRYYLSWSTVVINSLYHLQVLAYCQLSLTRSIGSAYWFILMQSAWTRTDDAGILYHKLTTSSAHSPSRHSAAHSPCITLTNSYVWSCLLSLLLRSLSVFLDPTVSWSSVCVSPQSVLDPDPLYQIKQWSWMPRNLLWALLATFHYKYVNPILITHSSSSQTVYKRNLHTWWEYHQRPSYSSTYHLFDVSV